MRRQAPLPVRGRPTQAPRMTQPSAPVPFGLAIVNALVFTGDPRRPWADAVLVRDGRVAAIGSSADIRKRTDASVRVVDAKRRMLTRAPARASDADAGFGDEPLGSLAAGTPADLVLLDRDISSAAPAERHEARVVLRVAGGHVVFDPDGLTP